MDEFWYTPATMREIKGNGYQAFKMFGPTYCFWLILLVLLCVLGKIFFPKMSQEKRHKVYVILTWLMLIDEVAKYVMTLLTHQFEWQLLPFHLCSINIFVCLWHTLHPTETAKEALYSICIPAALVALLSPNWICLPLFNFMHIHSALMHVLLILYPWLILCEGYRPNPKNILKVLAYLLCATGVAFVVNSLVDTNFFFLRGHNNNPALILISNIFGKFYLVGLIALVLVVLFLMYLPWLFRRKAA